MDEFIIEIKNAYPDELCDEFLHEWVTPKYHAMSVVHPNMPMELHSKIKSSQDMYFDFSTQSHNKYQDIMTKVKKKYTDILIENGLDRRSPTPPEVYMFQDLITRSIQTGMVMARNDPGQHYDWRVDSVFGDLSRQGLLTCILYLNDMDEDAGGCTEFSNGRVVRPEKGKVLIFPATPQYLHRGAIVNKGTKYVITTFAKEPEPVYTRGLPFIVKPDH
tara:strand:- start:31 stop:684 length:654 start_codon:yes stop_codon:yes gene_type:complete